MNILITGGTGLLGSHLAHRLCGEHSTTVLSRGLKGGYLKEEAKNGCAHIKCDLADKDAVKIALSVDTDLVIHCAGMVKISQDGRCPESLIENNVVSTLNLLEAMADKGIKRLIFASSMTVYSPGNMVPVKENGMLRPCHFYGLSKKWAEESIIEYADKGLIRAIIIRYPGLFGNSRKDGYIYSIAKKMLKGEPVSVDTNGLKFWESINVEDASAITERLLNVYGWSKPCDIVNCSYGQEVDIVDVAYMIKEMIASSSSIEVVQPLGYARFYMDNAAIRNILNDYDYSFSKGLESFLTNYKD